MDLKQYRSSDTELERTEDLLRLVRRIPNQGQTALDVGARDGHFSKLLTSFYGDVTALDLERPSIHHEHIRCVQGDIASLDFSDDSFDLVFCAEVLEHIPPDQLEKACSELSRISRELLLIGVPYMQDTRVGRTTCHTCGGQNPPWGHVNRFDRKRLLDLFPSFEVNEVSFVGELNEQTNSISTFFMDIAGNPYGTYEQEEACIHCGKRLINPPERTLLQKVFTKIALCLRHVQKPFYNAHPNWIHVLFRKRTKGQRAN